VGEQRATRLPPQPAAAPGSLLRTPHRYPDELLWLFRAARFATSRIWPGRAVYARSLRRGGLVGEQVDVPVRGLHPDADGLRLVQLSDLHGGPFVDEAVLQPVVALARSFQPHLLCLTGDYVTRTWTDALLLGRVFAAIDAPLGRYAVFGNHDYRHRREGRIAAVLRRQGVTVLRNSSVLIRHGRARLRLAGLEDIEEAKVADLAATTADFDGSEHARVLLCHHPDVVDQLPPGLFDLVLSGHSHGGQIVLPGWGSLGRRWMPQRLAGGYALPGGGLLHVNRGVGVLILPFRVGAPAEVTCLTLRCAPEAGCGPAAAAGPAASLGSGR